MTTVQRDRALEFIDRLNRTVTTEWVHRGRGFNWYVPHSDKIMGFVRYNVRQPNAGHYTIYTNTHDFDNSFGLFTNEQEGEPPQGWKAFVHPDNEREMGIVLGIMRGIIDGS